MKFLKHIFALKVVSTYAVVGTAWIFLSDSLVLFLFAGSPQAMAFIGAIKGELFVLVTSGLLYGQLYPYVRDLETQRAKLIESEARFRSIFNSVTDAIVIHRIDDFSIINVNQRAV